MTLLTAHRRSSRCCRHAYPGHAPVHRPHLDGANGPVHTDYGPEPVTRPGLDCSRYSTSPQAAFVSRYSNANALHRASESSSPTLVGGGLDRTTELDLQASRELKAVPGFHHPGNAALLRIVIARSTKMHNRKQ